MHTHRNARGFTLIELLIVVVIIGILAAVAVPKFQNTKGKAYASSIRSDLRNISSRQEDYFYYNETYTTDLMQLGFDGSNGVQITMVEGDPGGWSATATHPSAFPMVCAVYYGGASPLSPATKEGVVECQ